MAGSLPPRTPLIGLVSPCRNRRAKTLRFLDAVNQQTFRSFRVYLVDSNSTDGTPEYIRRFHPVVTVLHADDSKFWTGATNLGVSQALADGCDYVLTINDDSVIPPDFLAHLVDEAQTRDLDVLSARIEYQHRPGLVWAIGACNDWATGELFQIVHTDCWIDDLPASATRTTFQVEAMCGNGVLIHRRVFGKIGLYDEKWTPHYHADSEFVLRAARAGFGLWITNRTVLYNDAFNDSGSAVAPPARLPVVAGDTGSLIRRLKSDWRDLFVSIRSVYYWRSWFIVIWRFCPPALKYQCAKAAVSRIYRQFFRDLFRVWRGQMTDTAETATPPKGPPVPIYSPGLRATGPQPRGELTVEVWDSLSAQPDEHFTPNAYLQVLGRFMEPDSNLPGLLQFDRGRERILRAIATSSEADNNGLSHRTSPLVTRLLKDPPPPMTRKGIPRVRPRPMGVRVEDLDELDNLSPTQRVTAAYRQLLRRDPDEWALPAQLEAATQSTAKLLAVIAASDEFRNLNVQMSDLVRRRLRLPLPAVQASDDSRAEEETPQPAVPEPDVFREEAPPESRVVRLHQRAEFERSSRYQS